MNMLTCPLCNEEVAEFHKRSHILPEWMYTKIYNKNHKALEVSKLKKKVTKRQKGYYGQFICKNCESESQNYDHYASLILTNRSPNSPEHKLISKDHFEYQDDGEKYEYEEWKNIDFKKFQRFVLACVLRTQLAGQMKGLTLNQKHFEKILALYHSDSMDDISYPIVVIKNPDNDEFRNQVIIPFIKKQRGHHIIEFAGTGFIFNVYVSSHNKLDYVNAFRLKNDGSMVLIIMMFKQTGLFWNTQRIVKAAKKVSKGI
ncbi:MAG: hypothetical protein JW925_09730 [Syntrophaceae bacterium]|nr:hypothetical protein [Syntrophaceae bacterium]